MKYKELEYSRTFNLGQFQSEKITLSVDLGPIEDLDEAFRTVKAKVFKLHEEGKLLEETKQAIEAMPKIDLAELEELPWTKWKKDEQGNRIKASPGEPGWIKNAAYFTDFEAPAVQLELTKALKKAGGKLDLGQYLFSFSGKEEPFITRRPKKK